MSGVLKLAAVGVAAAMCSVVVKKQVPELALALVLAAGAIILSVSLRYLQTVVDFLDELAELAGLSPAVLSPVVKVVGIAIVSRTAAEICRDAKEGGLASFVETAATVGAILATLPLLRGVLDTVTGLL